MTVPIGFLQNVKARRIGVDVADKYINDMYFHPAELSYITIGAPCVLIFLNKIKITEFERAPIFSPEGLQMFSNCF